MTYSAAATLSIQAAPGTSPPPLGWVLLARGGQIPIESASAIDAAASAAKGHG